MVDLNLGGYATVPELAGWIVPASVPDRALALLRAASYVIGEATNRNPYTDTPDTTSAAVLRDATLAQAASWITLGIDPDALGIDGPAPVSRSSILDATVEYDTKAATAARSLAARELAPQAESILQAAGLLWVPLPVWGETTETWPGWGQSRTTFGTESTDWSFG